MVRDLEDFRKHYSPLSSRRVLTCGNYCRYNLSLELIYVHGLECLFLSCTECYQEWYVCKNCRHQRSPTRKLKGMWRHYMAHHHISALIKKPKKQKIEGNADNSGPQLIDITSARIENREYFSNNHDSHGPAYLVALSQYHLKSISKELSTDDVILQMKFAKLFQNLDHTKVIEMTDIIAHLQRKTENKKISSKWECKIPLKQEDVRSLYKEGKNCIYGNLPHPKIITISDHAYVSVIEIISDAMAHDLTIGSNYDEMEDEMLEIKFMRWSDDFEPTTGNKANRGNGIWVSTITLLSPADTKVSVYNTYL